jgi:hypothetical protein
VSALRLTYVSPQRVEFALVESGVVVRPVLVLVGSGRTWRAAVRFPAVESGATASLGDDALDDDVCWRAAEELARLEGHVRAVREGWTPS